MKPSDIDIRGPIPLTSTFGRVEREVAAALLVLGMRARDEWGPVAPEEMYAAIVTVADDPDFGWLHNPFARHNIAELIQCGFARYVGEQPNTAERSIEFTELGLERLRESPWNRATQPGTVAP